MAVEEPEKIISDMCDKLYARGYVKENFKEGVLKRERLSPTSFFHGFCNTAQYVSSGDNSFCNQHCNFKAAGPMGEL